MQITIQTQSKNKIPLEVQLSDTVESVKKQIEAQQSVAPSDQRLLFQGMQLEEGRTLQSYKIQDGSIVYLITR